MMVTVLASAMMSGIAFTTAKMAQTALTSVNATKVSTQAEQYALGQASLIKATNYSDLAAQSRQVIQNSDGFDSEVTLSDETEISTGVNQRLATVKIYKTGENLPRAVLVVPKTNAEVEASGGGVPVGTIIAWASNTAPTDGGTWLLCNGQSCSAYPELVALVGSTVPNLHGRFLEGTKNSDVRTTKAAGLPNITGYFTTGSWMQYTSELSGAFYNTDGTGGIGGNKGDKRLRAYFDASRSSAVYGKSTTVQPPSYLVRFYIKAA